MSTSKADIHQPTTSTIIRDTDRNAHTSRQSNAGNACGPSRSELGVRYSRSVEWLKCHFTLAGHTRLALTSRGPRPPSGVSTKLVYLTVRWSYMTDSDSESRPNIKPTPKVVCFSAVGGSALELATGELVASRLLRDPFEQGFLPCSLVELSILLVTQCSHCVRRQTKNRDNQRTLRHGTSPNLSSR